MTPSETSPQPASPQKATIEPLTSRAWNRFVTRPLLLALMATALVVGIVLILQIIRPQRPWHLLLLLSFLAAVEGVYTTLWLHHPDRVAVPKFTYRVAELVFILALFRFIAWAVVGNFPDLEKLNTYILAPLSFFDSDFFTVGIFLILFTWQRGITLSAIFSDLAITRSEAIFYGLESGPTSGLQDSEPLRINRSQLVANFFRQWIWGGVLIILLAAVTTYDLGEAEGLRTLLTGTRLGLAPEMLITMLIYFLAGFWLLSQARLMVMRARWMANRVQKTRPVERSWRRSSIGLLLAAALLAAFLPIGSTIAISRILTAIAFGGLFILNLLISAFFSLVAIILSLLARLAGTDSQPRPELPPPDLSELAPPPEAFTPSQDLQAIFGSFFWAIIVVGAIFAILFFLRERKGFINVKFLQAAWRALKSWWHHFRQGLSSRVKTMQQTIRTRLRASQKGDEAQRAPWRFIRLNALSPRDQIRYFYLSIVRRAGQRGVARQQSETPLEYAQDLAERWPDTEVDIEGLTSAFLKARYSADAVEKEEALTTKEKWRRLRARIRQRLAARKKENDGKETEA